MGCPAVMNNPYMAIHYILQHFSNHCQFAKNMMSLLYAPYVPGILGGSLVTLQIWNYVTTPWSARKLARLVHLGQTHIVLQILHYKLIPVIDIFN